MANLLVKSLKYLAEGFIDYAGMFPPASLDLQTAFNNYIKYLEGPYSWMLSKFICPANKLSELSVILKDTKDIKHRIHLSILGQSSENSIKFINSIKEDISCISLFNNKNSQLADIDVYEIPLPAETSKEPDTHRIRGLVNDVSSLFESTLNINIKYFYEYVPSPNLSLVIKALWYHNKGNRVAGYKLRTGGTDASSFPTQEDIAHAIKTCREYEVPMKCTAGLHHPISHYDDRVKAKMTGFLNLFGAASMEHCHNTTEEVLSAILRDENAEDFTFTENAFKWKNLLIMASEVERGRKELMISFGSCSFEEPIEYLKKMNLL